MSPNPQRPLSFKAAIGLHCPYCHKTPLLAHGRWFSFADGCQPCDYRYSREEGYFTGASWMVLLPLVSTLAFMMAGCLLAFTPMHWALNIGLTSVVTLVLGALLTPYSMAVWLYLDHRLHPLRPEEHFTDPEE